MAEIFELHKIENNYRNITETCLDLVSEIDEVVGDIEDMFLRYPSKMAKHADGLDKVMARIYFLMSKMHEFNGN